MGAAILSDLKHLVGLLRQASVFEGPDAPVEAVKLLHMSESLQALLDRAERAEAELGDWKGRVEKAERERDAYRHVAVEYVDRCEYAGCDEPAVEVQRARVGLDMFYHYCSAHADGTGEELPWAEVEKLKGGV